MGHNAGERNPSGRRAGMHVSFGCFDARFKTSCRENSYRGDGKGFQLPSGLPARLSGSFSAFGRCAVTSSLANENVGSSQSFFLYSFFGGETRFGSKLDKNKSKLCSRTTGDRSGVAENVWQKSNFSIFSISAEHIQAFDSCQKNFDPIRICPQNKKKTKRNPTPLFVVKT